MSPSPLAWVPLLQSLTAEFPQWSAWKHLDRALNGLGDVDSTAPRRDWEAVTTAVSRWFLDTTPQGTVLWCDHVPDVRLVYLLDPARLPVVDEIDLAAACSLGGVRWAHAARLADLSYVDEAGIRRLRPGAESLALVLLYGVARKARGSARMERDMPTVQQGLREDRAGADLAVRRLFPLPLRPFVRNLVDALAAGEPTGRAAGRLFVAANAASVLSPGNFVNRARFKSRPLCPVAALALRQKRQLPAADLEQFLTRAAASGHQIVRAPGPQGNTPTGACGGDHSLLVGGVCP